MNAIPLLVILGAAVPDAVAGPDLAEKAVTAEAPITEVTVYSDRARVTRVGKAKLAKGVVAVQLPDLPGGVMMSTVHVGADGGKVLRVQVTPVERDRVTIEEVDALISRLEVIQDEMSLIDAENQVLQVELGWLSRMSPKTAVPEQERYGKSIPALDPKGWATSQGFVTDRTLSIRQVQRKLAIARRELSTKYASVQREMQRMDLGALTERRVQVLALIESGGGNVTLSVEYFVPGAAWWPAYDVDYDAGQGKITLKTAGLVRQTTGETWENVRLELSTAIPGQGIELPELLTWTLGEKKEFIPRPRPESALPQPPRYGMPQPRPIASEADRAARRQLLAERVSRLRSMANMPAMSPGQLMADSLEYKGRATSQTLLNEQRAQAMRAKRSRPSPPPRPRPSRRASSAPSAAPSMAMAEPEPAMDYGDMDESVAYEAEGESILGGLFTSSKDSAPVRQTALGLFEAPTLQKLNFGDRSLPAVIAGGLDYVYVSPTPATIPSSSEKLRVPLASATWDAKTHYEATPALMKTAFLTARLKNQGKTPVLAGPVNIFMAGDFAGQGRLETTGPGGEIDLPLGADEDIRLEHRIVPSSRTEGLFGKDDVTDYEVVLQVANYKKRTIEVELFDVLPKSVNEDIEVELLSVKPKASDGPDKAKGRLTWRLKVGAGKTEKVTFTYRIKRPENWQLHQR